MRALTLSVNVLMSKAHAVVVSLRALLCMGPCMQFVLTRHQQGDESEQEEDEEQEDQPTAVVPLVGEDGQNRATLHEEANGLSVRISDVILDLRGKTTLLLQLSCQFFSALVIYLKYTKPHNTNSLEFLSDSCLRHACSL